MIFEPGKDSAFELMRNGLNLQGLPITAISQALSGTRITQYALGNPGQPENDLWISFSDGNRVHIFHRMIDDYMSLLITRFGERQFDLVPLLRLLGSESPGATLKWVTSYSELKAMRVKGQCEAFRRIDKVIAGKDRVVSFGFEPCFDEVEGQGPLLVRFQNSVTLHFSPWTMGGPGFNVLEWQP